MKGVELDKVNKLYQDLFAWVRSFVSEEEAQGLTNQLHYIARKHSKRAFTTGMIFGFIVAILLLKWLA